LFQWVQPQLAPDKIAAIPRPASHLVLLSNSVALVSPTLQGYGRVSRNRIDGVYAVPTATSR
jgi:hypothetical protein